jgi:hypothetical protein
MVIDPALDHAHTPSSEVPSKTEQRLNGIQSHYLSAPKPNNPNSPAEMAQSKAIKAQAQWDELNQAIVSALAALKQKEKKSKNFVFPQSIFDNLNKFNTLRLQQTLDGTPLPSSVVSLATAQSSIRQHKTANLPQKSSGIYLAKLI